MTRTIKTLSPEQQAATELAARNANGPAAQAALAAAAEAKLPYMNGGVKTQTPASAEYPLPKTEGPILGRPEHIVTGLE